MRVDVRVDDRGAPWILEVNANPCSRARRGLRRRARPRGAGVRRDDGSPPPQHRPGRSLGRFHGAPLGVGDPTCSASGESTTTLCPSTAVPWRRCRSCFEPQFAGACTPEDIDELPDRLGNPFKKRFRTVLYIAENSQRRVAGFAVVLHDPDVKFSYLDYLAASGSGRGVGAACTSTFARRRGGIVASSSSAFPMTRLMRGSELAARERGAVALLRALRGQADGGNGVPDAGSSPTTTACRSSCSMISIRNRRCR